MNTPPRQYCGQADLTVRSVVDGDIFKVSRECLARESEVFRDMFSCCDAGYVLHDFDPDGRMLELNEPTVALDALFKLLHAPPEPFKAESPPEGVDFTRVVETIPKVTIPHPLLPALFKLADKYALSKRIVHSLHTHLASYASERPLQVYGQAVTLGLDEVAAKASEHLLHPPLTRYAPEEVRVVPTEAYQKLLLLHAYRVKMLSEILQAEKIFPHGYGQCPRHAARTKAVWETMKHNIAERIEAATDVAAEMAGIEAEVQHCDVCSRACSAAIAMLAYKCGRLPKRIDKIPMDG